MPGFLLMLVFTVTAFAQTDLSLRNDREGRSVYASRVQNFLLERTKKKVDATSVIRSFRSALSQQTTKACAYTLNEDFQRNLDPEARKASFKRLLHLLREENEIDDVVLGILLRGHKVKTTNLSAAIPDEELFAESESASDSKIKQLIASFEKRFQKNSCFDEAYRSLYAEILNLNKEISSSKLEVLNLQTLREARISESTYVALEQARLNKLEESTLSLATYLQKLRTLRIQYPLRDRTERSAFVTEKLTKAHLSRRQRLFQNYSELQIILMGNVIKKLRSRLESPKVEILIYDKEAVQETIPLEPMERFRFAIRLLRKEMKMLSLNTYFSGRSPSYEDLMTASYEIGVIPASELDEIAGLEELWNPKRTFWDKAGVWIQTFGSIATIVIPPPYGFLPALALVVIQSTTGNKKQQATDDAGSLF